ncbi:hypothetical protein BIY23_03120 [Wolbachia pipientis]|uniref:Uncharacterized protein n=1 Tax=Wolbachia pipientis TaxID=955 RepID=A0A1E7QKC1_WOLPI|nr:hypothetical protein [Wolbachia pipientis]OEY86664.1 hypothetical protein BIY23_03120 [Wolbachia pipientis]
MGIKKKIQDTYNDTYDLVGKHKIMASLACVAVVGLMYVAAYKNFPSFRVRIDNALTMGSKTLSSIYTSAASNPYTAAVIYLGIIAAIASAVYFYYRPHKQILDRVKEQIFAHDNNGNIIYNDDGKLNVKENIAQYIREGEKHDSIIEVIVCEIAGACTSEKFEIPPAPTR